MLKLYPDTQKWIRRGNSTSLSAIYARVYSADNE